MNSVKMKINSIFLIIVLILFSTVICKSNSLINKLKTQKSEKASVQASSMQISNPPNPKYVWEVCGYYNPANISTSCLIRGPQIIRFGIPDRWIYKEVTDNTYCGFRSNSFNYQNDPAPYENK